MPSLVPIDHDPFNGETGSFSLAPVEYDPFAAEQFANPAVKGMIGGLATLPRRAIENSAYSLQSGNYDPGPTLEAATLPMGTGAIAGVPVRGGEAVLGAGPIRAYHGSPHDFDAFSMDKIGTGEGAQAYGHGLYFADNEGVARSYRDALAGGGMGKLSVNGAPTSGNTLADTMLASHGGNVDSAIKTLTDHSATLSEGQRARGGIDAAMDTLGKLKGADIQLREGPGHMYEVNINADPAHFLDWDKPLSEQPDIVKKLYGGLPEQDYAQRYSKAVAGMGGNPDAAHAAILDLTHNPGAASNDASWKVLTEGPQPQGFDLNDIHDKLRPVYFDRFDNTYHPRTGRDIEGGVRHPDSTQDLAAKGIPGIKYLDQGSRGAGQGSSNYVVFNHDLINIVRKYAAAGIALPPAIAAEYQSRFKPVDHDPFEAK